MCYVGRQSEDQQGQGINRLWGIADVEDGSRQHNGA